MLAEAVDPVIDDGKGQLEILICCGWNALGGVVYAFTREMCDSQQIKSSIPSNCSSFHLHNFWLSKSQVQRLRKKNPPGHRHRDSQDLEWSYNTGRDFKVSMQWSNTRQSERLLFFFMLFDGWVFHVILCGCVWMPVSHPSPSPFLSWRPLAKLLKSSE